MKREPFGELISGSRIRTYDLKIMSLASYQTALSRSLCFFVADLTPRGIRIPVSSVKGRCPGPLDDGGFFFFFCVENSYLSFLNITESKEATFFYLVTHSQNDYYNTLLLPPVSIPSLFSRHHILHIGSQQIPFQTVIPKVVLLPSTSFRQNSLASREAREEGVCF